MLNQGFCNPNDTSVNALHDASGALVINVTGRLFLPRLASRRCELTRIRARVPHPLPMTPVLYRRS